MVQYLKACLERAHVSFDFIAEEKQPGTSTCTVLVWLRISYEI